jgi:hypothetical protein
MHPVMHDTKIPRASAFSEYVSQYVSVYNAICTSCIRRSCRNGNNKGMTMTSAAN